MYRAHKTIVVCLLILLNSAECFKLFRNGSRLDRHLRKQPFTSIARQLHTCITNCGFGLSFNDPLVLPDECVRIQTDKACEMITTIDYLNKYIFILSIAESRDLTINETVYDSVTMHLAYMEFFDNSIYHIVVYSCENVIDCEWKYMQEIIPKLIIIDYQPLLDSLSPLVHNSNGHPTMTQCYSDTALVNCSTGSCWFSRTVDSDHYEEVYRYCAVFQDSSVEVGKIQYTVGPEKYSVDMIDFTCDKDKCNDQTNEQAIRMIISSKGNEFISTVNTSSLGTRFQLTIFSLYFWAFALIYIFVY